jgi:hypothetical protein
MPIANAQQVRINATPERVWEVITAFDTFPEWNKMTPTMKGELKVGGRLKGSIGAGPLKVPFYPTLLTVEPNVELRWKGGVPGAFTADHRFIVEDLGNGVTQLRHHETFAGVLALSGPTLKTANKVHANFNAALKQRAEASN